MLSRNLVILGVLVVASVAGADDTLIVLPVGDNPNEATGASTIMATWNGTGYDTIPVVAWVRDIGDTSAVQQWRGYQVAFDAAIPTAGCTGDVNKITGAMTLDETWPEWFHAGYAGFHMVSDAPGTQAMAMSSIITCPCPDLDDEAKYLCNIEYEIAPGSSGLWIVRPRCLEVEECPTTLHCRHSYVACTEDEDCPRYNILGDDADVCTEAISLDAETFFHIEDVGRAQHDVFELAIEIPVGQCCDGDTCLGEWTQEDCAANPAWTWTYGRDCLDPCGDCGNGSIDGAEDCDDGNTTNGDGCDNNCTFTGCGNGIVTDGEDCDDGNTVNTDECLGTCTWAGCGDGFVWEGEESCDDGNTVNTDDCLDTCDIAVCGDGFLWAAEEACDDGNLIDGDGCSSTCHVELAIEGATPQMDESLWRAGNNIFSLHLPATGQMPTAPEAGQIVIQELLPDGAFGDDLSTNFSFTLEDGSVVVREQTDTLQHETWYAVRNTGGWSGVQAFEVHYMVLVGDANNDNRVLPNDLSFINSVVPAFSVPEDSRYDVHGDGRVLVNDLSLANVSIPAFGVEKPSGH